MLVYCNNKSLVTFKQAEERNLNQFLVVGFFLRSFKKIDHLVHFRDHLKIQTGVISLGIYRNCHFQQFRAD